MAPTLELAGTLQPQVFPRGLNLTDTATVPYYILSQLANPTDILSVLLLLGPEIVRTAVAQLAGRIITPVAFSFGWLAYSVTTLISAFGDGRLMPDTDMANVSVIPATSGHQRITKSWILGRLLRDLSDEVDNEMRHERPRASDILNQVGAGGGGTWAVPFRRKPTEQRPWEALRVSVYQVQKNPPCRHGVPVIDWVWLSGCAVIVAQLSIAVVPWVRSGDWATFLVTAAGNLLALIGGSLPHWAAEKWACPKKGGPTVTLTQGNGSRHAIVILGLKGTGLHFEVLAQSTRTARASGFTRFCTVVLTFFWMLFLITVAGMRLGTWYLLGIGFLGSLQNLLAVGVARHPSALGVHMDLVDTISDPKVATVLRRLEEKHQLVGTSLLGVFFPGSLRAKGDDLEFWQGALDVRFAENKHGVRLDCLPRPYTPIRRPPPPGSPSNPYVSGTSPSEKERFHEQVSSLQAPEVESNSF